MNRGRFGRESAQRTQSNIPQSTSSRQRSSSLDVMSRGSYLPKIRRSASSERNSNSIAKPLFRGTPKKVSFGTAFPRNSSLAKKGPIKDPRPLSDRSYQKECINKLVDYLEREKFPYSITRNSLLLPTKKEFEMLFQFLYKFWDPKYEIAKIEDDVPKIMKFLNYPFSVTRSALVSITKMSWPSLLGVIMWLMDLNQCCSDISCENYISAGDFEISDASGIIMLRYICQSFAAGGNDKAMDDEIFTNLVRSQSNPEVSAESLLEDIEEIKKVIENEKIEQAEDLKLSQYQKEVQIDLDNYDSYEEKMSVHMKLKTATYKEIKEKKSLKEMELKELKEEAKRLERIYETQGFDGEQAQHFYNNKKETLTQKLLQKKEHLKNEEKEFWDLEIQLSQLTDKAETHSAKFGQIWDRFRSTGSSVLPNTLRDIKVPAAKKLCRDYKLNFPEMQLRPSFKDDLMPFFNHAKNYLEQQREQLQSIAIAQDNHIQQMNMKITDLNVQHQLQLEQYKQKERDMEMKSEEELRKIEELEDKVGILDKDFGSIHENRKKMEDILFAKEKERDEMKEKIQAAKNDLRLHEAHSAACLKDMDSMIENSIKKLDTLRKKLESETGEFAQFVEDNPINV